MQKDMDEVYGYPYDPADVGQRATVRDFEMYLEGGELLALALSREDAERWTIQSFPCPTSFQGKRVLLFGSKSGDPDDESVAMLSFRDGEVLMSRLKVSSLMCSDLVAALALPLGLTY